MKRAAPRKARPSARPLDSAALLARLDRDGMLAKIEGFSAQLRAGAGIAAAAVRRIEPQRPRAFVLIGMGGSAIAGDLLRILADREGTVPVHVVRHYEPPSWITPEDFLLFSSYSGETEETLSAYRALSRLGCRSAVIASGGSLADRARSEGLPLALLPAGFPPRAALGYSFSTLAHIAHHLGVLRCATVPQPGKTNCDTAQRPPRHAGSEPPDGRAGRVALEGAAERELEAPCLGLRASRDEP